MIERDYSYWQPEASGAAVSYLEGNEHYQKLYSVCDCPPEFCSLDFSNPAAITMDGRCV